MGTITVSSEDLSSGSTATITIAPDTGYVLDALTVTDEDGKEIELTKKNDTEYTFKMPDADVEIEVTYKQGDHTCSAEQFTDVNAALWYHEALDYVIANEMMQGTSNTTFAPMDNLSRGMMAQILYNLEGRPEVVEGNAFADVAVDAWYADAVTWAVAGSIVDGYSSSQYGPNDNITREQMVAMLYRYAQLKGYDTTQGGMAIREFNDYEDISAWALEAMTWAVNAGVINGDANNSLSPADNASRAEVAQIIMNFCEEFVK